MSNLIKIQDSIFCEPCIICGSRPAVEQAKGKYIVRCSADSSHYKTAPGLVDIEAWNMHNRPNPNIDDHVQQLKQG